MPELIKCTGAFASTAYGAFTLFDPNVPLEQRAWSSADHGAQWVKGFFAGKDPANIGIYRISRLVLPYAGSDMTVQRALIRVRIYDLDGVTSDILEVPEATIGRGLGPGISFSNDHPPSHKAYRPLKPGWEKIRNARKPIDLVLKKPVNGFMVEVFMDGYGWMAVTGFGLYGEHRKDLPGRKARMAATHDFAGAYEYYRAVA